MKKLHAFSARHYILCCDSHEAIGLSVTTHGIVAKVVLLGIAKSETLTNTSVGVEENLIKICERDHLWFSN